MHAEKKSTFTNNLNGLKELPEYVLKVLIEKKILLFEKSDHFYLSLKQNWFKEMWFKLNFDILKTKCFENSWSTFLFYFYPHWSFKVQSQ